MKKRLIILGGILVLFVALTVFLKTSSIGETLLQTAKEQSGLLLPIVLIAAIIDSINPCAFSVLLLTIAFFFSLGKSHREILKIGAVYIVGLYTVYVLIGLGILRALSIFGAPHGMAMIGAGILAFVGILSLVNHYIPSFPIKLKIPKAAHGSMASLMERASLPAAFALGVIVGLFEFPCTGGPYLLILGLLHDSQTYLTGLGYLAIYNFVFVLPLILILLIAGDKGVLAKVDEWKKTNTGAMRVWGGIAMLALAAIMFLLY
ncbi:hypothetical protein CL629_03875 [bacterium]|nr:hypothetical protein [bacterium]|tara:strand:+ start:17705 stop:18490 length:786 start_codon:yes stop_codon:yes gene_type:complete